MKKMPNKIITFALMLPLIWGFSVMQHTNAYFNDTESSTGNTFTAGTLDFSLISSANFSPVVNPTTTDATRIINVNNDGSLGFQYRIKTENISGDLCNSLNLVARLDSVEQYNGTIAGFNQSPFIFTNPEAWDFTAHLNSSDLALQGLSCTFDLTYSGWQNDLAEGAGGFTDIETISNTISASYWNPPIVLNEFLPNAGEYQEFVEIYNKTSSAIDLSGFYIKADDNTIPIDTTTTAMYSSGSTTIPANGWLVVTTGGDLINNVAGIVTLYNSSNIVVDTYAYGAPVDNANNTPGWTNNLIAFLPFNGDFLDKSGNGNNGTSYGASLVTGKINQGASFDGVSNYIEIADSSSLDITNQITIETWIKPAIAINSTNSNARIIDKQNAYYLLFDYPGADGRLKLILRVGGNYVDVSSITDSWNADQWYHIVGTYDGSTMNIYVDGVLENSKSQTGNIENSTYKLFLGTRAVEDVPTNMFFNGLIDETKIYDRALNSTEVADHHNAVGVGSAVPIDKSYARIPDGVGAWVDPIPTPGTPNELALEIIPEEESVVIALDPIISEPASDPVVTPDPIISEPIPEPTPDPVVPEPDPASIPTPDPIIIPEDPVVSEPDPVVVLDPITDPVVVSEDPVVPEPVSDPVPEEVTP